MGETFYKLFNYGQRISLEVKTEHMHCNFSKRQEEYDLEVKMGEDVIPHVTKFKYMGSII